MHGRAISGAAGLGRREFREAHKMATQIPTLEELLPAVEEDLRRMQSFGATSFWGPKKIFSDYFAAYKSAVLPADEVSRILNEFALLFENIFDFVKERTNDNREILFQVNECIEDGIRSLSQSLSGPTRCGTFDIHVSLLETTTNEAIISWILIDLYNEITLRSCSRTSARTLVQTFWDCDLAIDKNRFGAQSSSIL
jgi:hypothetical protein